MEIPAGCVGLKAKTPEGLNLDNAAAAHVVVLLEKTSKSRSPERRTGKKKTVSPN
jgi:hypothetical protein